MMRVVQGQNVPEWNVNRADYQNSANMTAALNVDYEASIYPGDVPG